MTSTRDSQRKRLYDAEHAVATTLGLAISHQTISNGDLQAFVDGVLARRAVASRWPSCRVAVVLKRGGRAIGYRTRITLPLFARNEWVVLHEVAHSLTPDEYASHGREYAGVLLFLVQTVLGREAGAALRAAYRSHRVRWSNLAVPPPMSAEEQRLRRALSDAQAERRRAEARVFEAAEALDAYRSARRNQDTRRAA